MTLEEFIAWFEKVFGAQLFTINQTPITVSSLLMFILVLTLFWVGSRILGRIVLKPALGKLRIDSGTEYNLVRITHYTIMLIGALVAFQFIGIDLSGLVMIFGLLSVGIGFGLQNITSNFIAGLILLIERPIRVGDRIMVGETVGDVIDINIRSTTVRSLKHIDIIVPNSDFVSKQVINWSHGDLKVRSEVDVGVSYGSDLDTVIRCLEEVASEHKEVLESPEPDVLHMGFGDSSWNMRLRAWISHPKHYIKISSDLNCAIVRKFRENGVEIPFPQRDLHVRSPLPVPLSQTEASPEPTS